MNKKGLVPPGMCEEITILFKPLEYKYSFRRRKYIYVY
jgi:hypothetical protein